MGPIYSLDDVIDMVRRRAFVMLLVISIGGFVSFWVAVNQADMFVSTEVIQIEHPEIAGEKATATSSWIQRLQVIEQRLKARGNLLEAIDEFGLYSDDPRLRRSDKVDLLRQAIQIQGVVAVSKDLADDGVISTLTITATLPTPEQAQSVAHRFAKQVIELSAKLRIAQARETLDFFLLQEEKLAARVAVLEMRVAGFRNSNDISNAGNVDIRRFEIAAINSAILEIDHQSVTLQRKSDQIDSTVWQTTADRMRAEFQKEIDNLEAQKTMLTERKQVLEINPRDQRELATFVRQLEQFQSQLDETLRHLVKAEVGFRLESQHQFERLTVLEPASTPSYPMAASRIQLVMTGVVFSIVSAFVLALLFDFRDRVLRTANHMQRELGYAPIVSIPFLDDSKNRS